MKFILNILRSKVLNNIFFHYSVIFIFLTIFTWALFYYDFFPIAQSETSNFLLPSHWVSENLESWSTFYMGHRNSISLNYITFFMTYFLKYNFPYPFLSQYIFYFSIFLIGIVGIYKLIGLFNFNYSKNFKIHRLYLSLLILSNPAFLFLINRFQFSFITLYLLFPLILYMTIKTFESRSNYIFIKYTLLINLVFSLYSFVYTSIPTLIILFIFWTSITVFYLIKNFNISFLLRKVLPFFIIWFLINSFWVVPFFIESFVSNNLFTNSDLFNSSRLNSDLNLKSLIFYSNRDASLINVLTLYPNINFEYFGFQHYVLEIFIYFINLTPVLIIIYTVFLLVKSYRYNFLEFFKFFFKSKYIILIYLLFINFILIRGSNFPFGYFYSIIFEKIVFLQIFRNVFEKGIILYSSIFVIIFCFSLIYLFKNKKNSELVYGFLFIYIILNLFPVFSSKILTGYEFPFNSPSYGFKVEVPDYYNQMSSIINNSLPLREKSGIERTLILPLVEEGITYKWNKGYIGADFLGLLSRYDYSFYLYDSFNDRSNILKNIYFAKSKKEILDMYGFKYVVFRTDFNRNLNEGDKKRLKPQELISFFKKDYTFNVKNSEIINNLYINNNLKNSFDNSKYYTQAGNFNVLIKKDNKISFLFDNKDTDTLPNPVIFIFELDQKVQDQSIEITYDNPSIKNTFNLKFSPDICGFCYVSEPVYWSDKLQPNSLNLIFKTNFESTTLMVKNIKIVKSIKSDIFSNYNELYTNKSELYSLEQSTPLITSTDKYIIYDTFLYFIFNEIDSENYTYISKNSGDYLLKNKQLSKVNVNYEKISEAEYNLEIIPNKKEKRLYSTVLNFKSSADSLWKLVYPDEFIFGRKSFNSDKNQFISNTFSNSYLVENIPHDGLKLKLIYLPYYYFKIFSVVSILTIFGLLTHQLYLRKIKNLEIKLSNKKQYR